MSYHIKKIYPYFHSVCKFVGLENKIYKASEPMNHIIDNIYLGDFRAADNLQFLKDNKITAIINCAYNLPSKFESEIKYLNLNLRDEKQMQIIPSMEQAYLFIKEDPNRNILVHCVYGKSRSASAVIFYLMKEKKWDYETCLNFVKEKRNIVEPNEGFKNQLVEYYQNNIATNEKTE